MSEMIAVVAGRSIKVKTLNETQQLFMNRDGKRAQRAAKSGEYQAAVTALVNVMEIIDHLIVDEDDRDFVALEIAKGTLEAPELVEAILQGAKAVEAEAVPQKRARAKRAAPAKATRGKAA